MRWGGLAIGGVFVGLLGIVLCLILVAGQAQQCGGAGSPTAPPAGTQTEAQVVRYLQSQGFSVTEADAVRFFELAHVDLDVRRHSHEACVVLKGFAIPSEDLIPPKVRERVESWSDLIDYWSVDFDFSDEVFHNQWQAYRTRETPALATQSDWHEYPEPGRYAIVVKIIDIFGNDTTKLAEVLIK